MKPDRPINPARRELLAAGVALGLASAVPAGWAAAREHIVRTIPGRDETGSPRTLDRRSAGARRLHEDVPVL